MVVDGGSPLVSAIRSNQFMRSDKRGAILWSVPSGQGVSHGRLCCPSVVGFASMVQPQFFSTSSPPSVLTSSTWLMLFDNCCVVHFLHCHDIRMCPVSLPYLMCDIGMSSPSVPCVACDISMSGRDIRDVCEQTERRWASMVSESEMMMTWHEIQSK